MWTSLGIPTFIFLLSLSVLTTFGSHCILHLKILPILVRLHLWPDLLSGTAIFFHVDNEAALHSLIRMSCDNHAADQLVQHFLRLEQRMTFDTWIHRVPTEVLSIPEIPRYTKHLEQSMERAAAVKVACFCTVSFLAHEVHAASFMPFFTRMCLPFQSVCAASGHFTRSSTQFTGGACEFSTRGACLPSPPVAV